MNRRIVIVGPSGAGKTTVAQGVAHALGLPLYSMDGYRARGHKLLFWVDHASGKVRDYEDPRMWDAHAIGCMLRGAVLRNSGFVAEGNHLLVYPDVAAIAAERFYLDLPFALSIERRRTRHRYLPADESFALIGEQQTALHVAPQRTMPNVRVLDGQRPVAELVQSILAG